MEDRSDVAVVSSPRAKVTLRLGSEVFSVGAAGQGCLSQQLAAMKEESMSILKDYITKLNALTDVPDEPIDDVSEDENETIDNPPKKSKKQK